MRELSIEVITAISIWLWPCPEPTPPQCPFPITEYKGSEQTDANLFEAEGWEVIELVESGEGKFQDGWIAVIETFGDDDPRIMSLTTDPDDRAQIYFQGAWMLQTSFEEKVCFM